ncbi:Methionyl-tRNA formyltransferase [hydrothermal vent metagenome]|uniref:Methionyl-tRNA formyltransferase n=1 Tax=hydrothermal vent metagenome TaxID=652676 RepID=A0A3B0ZNK9_9ZZZZ
MLPFLSLLNGPHKINAVVMNEPALQTNKLDVVVAEQASVKTVAFQNNINIILLTSSFRAIITELEKTPFDLIITSCFARKIPTELLVLARLGAVNLHPSMLPAYRGPDPLFWQLLDGVDNSGMTLHLMNSRFDDGAIVIQRGIPLQDDSTLAGLQDILGQTGAEILTEFLEDIDNKIEQAWCQSKNRVSYHSRPKLRDYAVSDQWPASRLFNFVRATLGRIPYYPITIKGNTYKLVDVLSYHPSIQRKLSISDNKICFSCHSGSVCAELLTD